MQRLGWATDIHLDHLTPPRLEKFCQALSQAELDALLISGDIADAKTLEGFLLRLESDLQRPIYFVLGNHDYYYGSIPAVRASMRALTERSPYLNWLPARGVIALTEQTGLIGHDGWADGRLGDYANSTVILNDYFLIKELSFYDKKVEDFGNESSKESSKTDAAALLSSLDWLSPEERLQRLNALGDEAAEYLKCVLQIALERFKKIILVTHVPPFKEASWHEGRLSDDNWLPHFTCKAVGDVLLEVMRANPARDLLVLCGHTHGKGETQMLPNLLVRIGGAVYGAPRLQEVLLVE